MSKALCPNAQTQKSASSRPLDLEKMKNDQRHPDDRIGHEADCQSYDFRAALLQEQIDHLHLKLFLFPQNVKIQFQLLIFQDLHLDFLLKLRVLSSPHYRQVGYRFLAQPYLSL